MQKTIIAACLLALSAASYATPEHDTPVKPPKPVKAAPVVNVTVTNTVKAVARAPRASSAPAAAPVVVQAPAAAPASEGSQTFVGGSVYERSAPGVSVAAPQQPLTSCRLGLSGGGSNSSGALGFGLVMGNDATCLVGAKLTVMERVGGFSADERTQVACEIEGMDKLETCKRIAQKAPAVARVEPLLP